MLLTCMTLPDKLFHSPSQKAVGSEWTAGQGHGHIQHTDPLLCKIATCTLNLLQQTLLKYKLAQ